MKEEKFITTQRALAKEAGITPQFLTLVKKRKARCSERVVDALSKLTGIRPYLLFAGTEGQVDKELKKFFEREQARKTLSK